jgi:hypothetical protein
MSRAEGMVTHIPAKGVVGAYQQRQPLALFALGCRPFFLVAGVAAVALAVLWVADYGGALSVRTYYGDINWHGHASRDMRRRHGPFRSWVSAIRGLRPVAVRVTLG